MKLNKQLLNVNFEINQFGGGSTLNVNEKKFTLRCPLEKPTCGKTPTYVRGFGGGRPAGGRPAAGVDGSAAAGLAAAQ